MKKLIWLIAAVLLVACSGVAGSPIPGGADYPKTPMFMVGRETLAAARTLPPGKVTVVPTANTMPGCTVRSLNPVPAATQATLFPPPSENDWSLGPVTATVTIIEYSDFQCPVCAKLAPVLKQIQQDFPHEVRFIYRHNPLIGIPGQEPYPFHDKAALSAQAAQAAGLQGKFWEMHDLLFARQSEWTLLTLQEFQGWLTDQARTLQLDVERFQSDLNDPANAAFVQKAWDDNLAIGLVFTPYVLINDQPWPDNLPKSYEMITTVVKLNLLAKRQYTSCPPMIIDPDRQYLARLHTSKGEIVLALFADKAPLTVNNFVFLARSGWYDGVPFHLVIPGFMAQTGDPSGTGYGSPGYAFANEIAPDLVFDRVGMVGMANSGPDTNGSQFFITYAPEEQMNGSFTIFGQVIEGMEVAEKLTPRNPSQEGELPEADILLRVEIEEK